MLDFHDFRGSIAELTCHRRRQRIRGLVLRQLPGPNCRIFDVERALNPAINLPHALLDGPRVDGFDEIAEVGKFRIQRQVEVVRLVGGCAE